MSEYSKVIDKYWVDFLASTGLSQGSEGELRAWFWLWFYKRLCEGSKTLAEQKWKEAQGEEVGDKS